MILLSVYRLLLTANVVLSSPILITLMMEALRSSKPSVVTRATRCYIREYGIFIVTAVKTLLTRHLLCDILSISV
jgi:hypothetical protein